MLIARKDPCRYPRVAARWLQRLLEEDPDLTIEEAALAATCLASLPGGSYRETRERALFRCLYGLRVGYGVSR
jgi:hypothetical protein